MIKVAKAEHAIVQSIRFSPENQNLDDSSKLFESKAYSARASQSSGEFMHFCFTCLDYDGKLLPISSLAPNKFKDIKISNEALNTLNYAYNKVSKKWVFLSGDYRKQSFDLSNDANGISNYLMSLVLDGLLGGFNKSKAGDLWIHPDNRAMFKNYHDTLKLVLFNAYAHERFGNDGHCYYINITLDFSKNKFSVGGQKSASIKSDDEPALSLDEAKLISEKLRQEEIRVKTAQISSEIDAL